MVVRVEIGYRFGDIRTVVGNIPKNSVKPIVNHEKM